MDRAVILLKRRVATLVVQLQQFGSRLTLLGDELIDFGAGRIGLLCRDESIADVCRARLRSCDLRFEWLVRQIRCDSDNVAIAQPLRPSSFVRWRNRRGRDLLRIENGEVCVREFWMLVHHAAEVVVEFEDLTVVERRDLTGQRRSQRESNLLRNLVRSAVRGFDVEPKRVVFLDLGRGQR